MSSPSEKDRELDAYLRGDSPLSRAYKENARELPPAHVDVQILAEAHRADAGSRKRRARRLFSASWMAPVSVTAVVVLAVSVAVLLPEGRPGYERQRDRFDDAATPAAEKSQPREAEQAPAPGYAPPPKPRETDEAASVPASPPDSRMAPAEPAAPMQEQRSLFKNESEPAAPAAAVPSEVREMEETAGERSRVRSQSGLTADQGLAGRVESKAVADAEAWLERIRALIERGEMEAARKSLDEFRRAHPGARVPQAIIEALAAGGN